MQTLVVLCITGRGAGRTSITMYRKGKNFFYGLTLWTLFYNFFVLQQKKQRNNIHMKINMFIISSILSFRQTLIDSIVKVKIFPIIN